MTYPTSPISKPHVEAFHAHAAPAMADHVRGQAVDPAFAEHVIELGLEVVADKAVDLAYRTAALQIISVLDQYTE